MKGQWPMGYLGAHEERTFPILCNEEDFVLKGTVQHRRKIQKVMINAVKYTMQKLNLIYIAFALIRNADTLHVFQSFLFPLATMISTLQLL